MCSVLQAGLLLAVEKPVCLEEVVKRGGVGTEVESSVVCTTNQSEPWKSRNRAKNAGGSFKLPGCGQVLGSPEMKRKEVGDGGHVMWCPGNLGLQVCFQFHEVPGSLSTREG